MASSIPVPQLVPVSEFRTRIDQTEVSAQGNLHPLRTLAQSDVPLTRRELIVAELAVLGNRDIALALGISPNTVRAHLANVARKTGLESRAAIAVWADRISRRAA
jgi:DNA-binding CsgD family transcriptional regulator